MGFFRKKKSLPLSTIMYQGDNTTPARREGKNAPLTPDTVDDDSAADAAAKNKKQGLFRKNKPKERYVKVTVDKKDEQEQQELPENERTALITPSKSSQYTTPATHNTNNVTDDSIPMLITPRNYEGLPYTPDEKIEDTKRNLNPAFDDSYEADDLQNTNKNSKNAQDKKFMKRFRSSWRKSPSNIQQKLLAQKLIEQQEKMSEQESPVPKVVARSDEGSVPSLITEITRQESIKKMGANGSAVAYTSKTQPAATAKGEANAQPQTFFGPSGSFSTTSKASRQPRQQLTLGEKFLSLLQCGEDTTSDGYFGRIRCLDLCGPIGEKDGLRLEKEEETRFVIQFMNEMSKQGIKLIYHKPPSPNDPSSDWTQITIKMFLRSGNCHDFIHNPTLAWATLPVASRKILTGSYEADESRDKEMWTHLSLWDIYSIMGAEDDATVNDDAMSSPARSKYTLGSTIQSEVDSRGDTYTRETASYTHTKGTTFDEERTIPSSGFFSITAGSDGNVHVFEAPSGSRRDYIVKGLKKLIRRASNHMIAGKLDVCAELYGEDAAPLSGELPSLVTPTQALTKVTHSFLDEV